MSQRTREIEAAVGHIRARIAAAGGRDVKILAVSKGFPWADVRAAMDVGLDTFGENYAKELVGKFSPVPPEGRPRIHFIGRLQSNKISQLAPFVSTWQSVDRARLVEEISLRSPGANVLIQVNVTGEPDKGGCAPGDVGALVNRAESLGLVVSGLMAVGPTSGDREGTRRAFAEAARLKTTLNLAELSMGMSHDLELAIEAGSTMVRVGTALFGRRPPKN